MPKLVKQPHGGALKMQQKGDKSFNPSGRPKKIWKQMRDRIEKEYGVVMSKEEILDMFEMLGKLNKEGLDRTATDPELPVIVQLYARALIKEGASKGASVQIAETIIDRVLGKSQQNIGISINIDKDDDNV